MTANQKLTSPLDPQKYVVGFDSQSEALDVGHIPPRCRKPRPYTIETVANELMRAHRELEYLMGRVSYQRGRIVALEDWLTARGAGAMAQNRLCGWWEHTMHVDDESCAECAKREAEWAASEEAESVATDAA